MANVVIHPNTGSLSLGGNAPFLTFNMLVSVSKTPLTGSLVITGKSLTVSGILGGPFAWRPNTARLVRKPKVTKATFGEGYEQRQADGINNALATWELTFTGVPPYDAEYIEAYLKQMNGVTAFDWTPPNRSVSSKFVCDDWERDLNPEIDGESNITATFREVLG